MNKKICILAGIAMLTFSAQSLSAVKSTKNSKTTKTTTAKTDTKTQAAKPVLGKMSMDNWFGLPADKLRLQVKGTKDVFITDDNGQKVLAGLEKRETWFGMSGDVFYSLADGESPSGWDAGELQAIIITYKNAYYNTVVNNIEKQLKTAPNSNETSSGYDTISEAVFTSGKLRYEVREYLDNVKVEIRYDAN